MGGGTRRAGVRIMVGGRRSRVGMVMMRGRRRRVGVMMMGGRRKLGRKRQRKDARMLTKEKRGR